MGDHDYEYRRVEKEDLDYMFWKTWHKKDNT